MRMSKMAEYDVDGNEIDELAERIEKIKEEIEPTVFKFLDEEKEKGGARKKFGYRLTTIIDNKLRNYGLMSADDFVNITYDTIDDYFNKFRDLIAYYNEYFEIVANKQLFCAFMGINNRMYGQLEKHPDEDIKDLMLSINDYFIGLGFSASENGTVNSDAVYKRLRTKDAGHDIVTAAEDKTINALSGESPLELQRKLEGIVGKLELPKPSKKS